MKCDNELKEDKYIKKQVKKQNVENLKHALEIMRDRNIKLNIDYKKLQDDNNFLEKIIIGNLKGDDLIRTINTLHCILNGLKL